MQFFHLPSKKRSSLSVKKRRSTLHIYILAALITIPTLSFSQIKHINKPSPKFGLIPHSTDLKEKSLFAEGIKVKVDLKSFKDAKNENSLSFDETEIPADDLYGNLWPTEKVLAYDAVNIPYGYTINLDKFTMPVKGRMTSNFGSRGRRYHEGVDIKAITGDTVYAAFDGKVRIKTYQRGGYGNCVVLRHPNGLETVYGHFSKHLLKVGDVVKSGDPIGLAGSTGRSTGSHLHFEIRFLGRVINPNKIIDFQNFVCHRDTYEITRNSFGKTRSSSKRVLATKINDHDIFAADHKSGKKRSRFYKIKKYDTLGRIAKRKGLKVSELCRLNKISARTVLSKGRTIRLN